MNLLYLSIVFPLIGFLLLAISRGRFSEKISAIIGVSSIGLSALVAIWVAFDFISGDHNKAIVFYQEIWTWILISDFSIPVTLMLDSLSLIMLLVVTSIGFLVHLYASWYMQGKSNYHCFFVYTNLFIASMIVLILADNLLVMYLGWEGVGLCSYLLIGFYYTDNKNVASAFKAFVMTRVGDVMLLCAIFILYNQFGTLNFYDLMILSSQNLIYDSLYINFAMLMLLGGAIGKSAQLPLHTWLVDAMVGPTPVSALIHSATMVTAGVYLIARTYNLFLMVPDILYLIGVIGAITLICASLTALIETNIKHILAYSTMSQIGYMFLSLGLQGYHAAIFHLMMHAVFKSLLFIATGSIVLACHGEQNIFKMGGLYKSFPFVYMCFLMGGASLSAMPAVTSGFYSKEKILYHVFMSGHTFFMLIGVIGTFLTSLYTFRMIFIVFHGKENINVYKCYSVRHYLSLGTLLILSSFIGIWITFPIFNVLPDDSFYNYGYKLFFEIVSSLIGVFGICVAAFLWLSNFRVIKLININIIIERYFPKLLLNSWGFNWLYERIFTRPYVFVAHLLSSDPFDFLMNGFAILANRLRYWLTLSENGKINWYVASITLGAIIVLILMILY